MAIRRYLDKNSLINGRSKNQIFGERSEQILDLYEYIEEVAVDAVTKVKSKIIEIGDWDMDASVDGTASLAVAHGVTAANIRSVDAIIRNDAGDTFYPLNTLAGQTNVQFSLNSIDATNLNLGIRTAGFFDGTDFDTDTGYNRGWVLLSYVE
jgi:hypothetical protein